MRKKALLILLSLCILFSFTGCRDIRQLDERLIIKGIGIDYKEKKYEVTLMYLGSEPAESGKEAPPSILSVKGKTVLDCMTNAVSKTGQELLYSHNLFIVLGKDLLEYGTWDAVEFFSRYYETRATVNMFAAEVEAKKVLNVKGITPEEIDNLAKTEQSSGRTAAIQLYQYVADAENKTQRSVMPSLKIDEDKKLCVNGSVVFKERKKAYALTAEESLGYLILTGRAGKDTEVITTEDDSLSFSLTKTKSDLEVKLKDNKLHCNFKISGVAELYEMSDKEEGEMRKEVNKEVKRICNGVAKESINKQQADILNIGRRLRQSDNHTYNQIEDWDKLLKDAEFNIDVDILMG